MNHLTKSESARVNGAKSRGPTTPEGRVISSMNSLKHRLTGKAVLLQNESPDEFTQLLNAYFDYLQPRNQIETDLVADMVAARWRLRRTWRYQTAMLDIEMDVQTPDFEKKFEKYDEDMRGTSAFTNLSDTSRALRTAIHFDIHLSRTYRRTLEQLRRLRQSENEPTKPPKTGLNDEKQHLKGEPE